MEATVVIFSPVYETLVNTADKAACHLFLHCCLKDGIFTDEELEDISSKIVALKLQTNMNFKNELVEYRGYLTTINNEELFIKHLLKTITPSNELALYSFCAELCVSDKLDIKEINLLAVLGKLLQISDSDQDAIQQLTIQRKAVAAHKSF